jgi:hypothetical protein
MIYVYAVIELPATGAPPLPAVCGLGARPVELRTVGPVGAVYTSQPPGAIPPTAQNVWLHEGVIESLMRQRAVLPARFGATFADAAGLDQALYSQAERLAAGLDHVRGCVELGLRVLWPRAELPAEASLAPRGPHDAPPDARDGGGGDLRPGRAYMVARLAREQRSRESRQTVERLAAEIHAELAPLARDSTRRLLPTPVPQMSGAYLVPGPQADTFNARVRQLAVRHPGVRQLCTGPWPPYHFVPTLAPAEAPHV